MVFFLRYVIISEEELDYCSCRGGNDMVATKDDAYSMIEAMSDVDFSELKVYLNTSFGKSKKRIEAEKRFVEEVKAAEESVKQGNYVTLSELHEFLES